MKVGGFGVELWGRRAGGADPLAGICFQKKKIIVKVIHNREPKSKIFVIYYVYYTIL
jgi:hypothetical protein